LQVLILFSPTPGLDGAPHPDDRFAIMGNALELGGVQAHCFPVGSDQQLIRRLEQERPDLIFSAAYYTNGSSISRQNVHVLLERLGYPYIGSNAKTLELVIAKASLKKQWQRCCVQTPVYVHVKKSDNGCPNNLEQLHSLADFPYIIKPAKEGNSRGIDEDSIVFDRSALIHQTALTLSLFGDVLVERYLGNEGDIREFTVAMIGSPTGDLILPAEIRLRRPRKQRVVTTQDKEEHNTIAVPLPDSPFRAKLCAFARKAFQAAGVRDYARCDILQAGGKLYAIEINGQPMVPDMWFGACAQGAGLDTSQYLNAIFLAGLTRLNQEGQELSIPQAMVDMLPSRISKGLLPPQIEPFDSQNHFNKQSEMGHR
jgi:D-alanine-D-alanine ligase-like ATP-grasp enzyme